jgi:hypothetical protein
MKKAVISVIILIVLIVLAVFAAQAIKKTGKAYVLAEELKTSGIPVEEIRINESGPMYNEVSAIGEELNVKIGCYGNGLFMENIIKNLESQKTKNRESEEPPILVSRLFILVVYSEPSKGAVKRALAEKFGQVREY